MVNFILVLGSDPGPLCHPLSGLNWTQGVSLALGCGQCPEDTQDFPWGTRPCPQACLPGPSVPHFCFHSLLGPFWKLRSHPSGVDSCGASFPGLCGGGLAEEACVPQARGSRLDYGGA